MTVTSSARLAAAAALLSVVAAGCSRPIFPSREAMLEQTLARFDADGDGVIDRSEYEANGGHELPFGEYDTDASGVIDLDELNYQLLHREPRPLVDRQAGGRDHSEHKLNALVEQREGTLP